jgi:hypothetical protein
VEAIHLSLARDLLARGLPWSYREVSVSMVPTLRPYDVVEVDAARLGELRPGNIVAVVRPEGLLVHRLLARLDDPRLGSCLLLRGDARAQCDPLQPVCRLLGKVQFVQRQGSRIEVDAPWRWWLLPVLRRWTRLRVV